MADDTSPADRPELLWTVSHAGSGKRFTCELTKTPDDRWAIRVWEHGGMSRRLMFGSQRAAITYATGLKGRVIHDGVME